MIIYCLYIKNKMIEPKSGERYLHFKGKMYEIICIAKDCDKPDKRLVVYKQLYSSENPIGTIWVRSLEDFTGYKEFNEDIQVSERFFRKGEKIKRFEKV
jgi:hypothetical protein